MEINKILSIKEQESFMHLIYDVIHNDISISSLQFGLENLNNKYNNLRNILNSRMKNEQYSEYFDIPIMKVIFENKNHIININNDEFIEKKIKVINLLKSYGATLNILNEKYMGEIPYWEYNINSGIINEKIYNMIINDSQNKIKITI